MVIEGVTPHTIEGEEYYTVKQFSQLTEKTEGTIRVLISKGNRIRKLKVHHIAGKPFILARELFEYPFVITGRPAGIGDAVERYYIDDDGNLTMKEELIKHDN